MLHVHKSVYIQTKPQRLQKTRNAMSSQTLKGVFNLRNGDSGSDTDNLLKIAYGFETAPVHTAKGINIDVDSYRVLPLFLLSLLSFQYLRSKGPLSFAVEVRYSNINNSSVDPLQKPRITRSESRMKRP